MIGEGVVRAGIGSRVAAGLLVAGIAFGVGGDARPPEAAAPAAPAVEYFNPDLPAGVCAEPKANDAELLAKARRCETAMHSGRVALVNFGLPPEVATGAAELMTEVVPQFNANLTMSYTAVTASPAAAKRFAAAISAKGCAEEKKPLNYASGVAEATMPELSSYDFVIGLTDTVSCRPDVNGSSNGYGGRRADIYLGNNGKGKPPAERLEILKRAGGMLGAHELMHLLDLGHAGIIAGDGDNLSLENAQVYLGHDFDLGAYLKKAHYEPYGDISNLVSLPVPDYVRPNTVDNAFLDWPKRVQGEVADVVVRVGAGKQHTITEADAAAGKFAMATLRETIQLPGKKTTDGTKPLAADEKFTKIAFVPRIGSGKNFGVDIMLISDNKAIGQLGGMSPENIGEDASSVITIGKQRFKVSAAGLEIKVRELV